MTQFLPPNLLALFAPREALKYIPPAAKLPIEKNLPPYSGLAAFINNFELPKDCPPPTRVETKDERKERQKKERAEQIAYKLEQDLAMWDPVNDTSLHGDPFKTLFCGRINYDTSESKLKREFDSYGTIRRIVMVKNSSNDKPRGYAFIEYEHERDMHAAYKHADGKKIDGRRVLVDVERGRTVKGWRPRRLGGGLGNTRRGGSDVNTRFSGREEFLANEADDRRMMESRGMSGDRRRSRSREKRSRDRGVERERERGGDRDRTRKRSRSPRDRGDRERRRRSRERRRSGERDPLVKKEPVDEIKTEPGLEDDKDTVRRHIRRSRSRDKERDRSRRSRSRDRKRKRSRSRERRDRRRDTNGDEREAVQAPVIKKELENMEDYEQEGYERERGFGQEGTGNNKPSSGYNRLEDM